MGHPNHPPIHRLLNFPFVVYLGSADGNYEVRYKSNVLIYPNGEVLWVPPAIYQSSCTIDVTYFPFDQQTCIMKVSIILMMTVFCAEDPNNPALGHAYLSLSVRLVDIQW